MRLHSFLWIIRNIVIWKFDSMSWDISELDKNKIEQRISNESIHIDNWKVTLEKLKKDYNYICIKHKNEELKLIEQIKKIEMIIESEEKFLEDCKNHLNVFDNEK